MDDPTLFRSAGAPLAESVSVASEPLPPITEKGSDHTEMPPSLYVEARRTPLVLDLLGGASAYEHFDMPVLTKEVNTYILEEMNREGLDDNREGYQQVLDKAIKSLDLPEGLDIYTTIEKLVRYLRIQHKLWSALRDKEELMAADPLTLSAAKLKKYLEMNHA